MYAPTVDAPYLYSPCPACEQQIRFTLPQSPDSKLVYDSEIYKQAIRLHLRHACEAVVR